MPSLRAVELVRQLPRPIRNRYAIDGVGGGAGVIFSIIAVYCIGRGAPLAGVVSVLTSITVTLMVTIHYLKFSKDFRDHRLDSIGIGFSYAIGGGLIMAASFPASILTSEWLAVPAWAGLGCLFSYIGLSLLKLVDPRSLSADHPTGS